MIKKIFQGYLYLFLTALILMNVSAVHAEPKEISAEGEYRLGDTDTRDKAKKAALTDAKRKIIEQAGVFVESYTEVIDLEFSKDQIKSVANAIIKIKSEQVDFYENGMLCKALMIATIDEDDVKNFLNVSVPSITKIDGLEEYNGHYYKLFDYESYWKDAKSYCEKLGGHLAVVKSQNLQDFIEKMIMKGTKRYYWIGGYKDDFNNWKWVTNELIAYSNWAIGEPNNNVSANENYIMIYRIPDPGNGSAFGKWNDLPNDAAESLGFDYYGVSMMGFICEWESAKDIK